jgi:hypothetical protein
MTTSLRLPTSTGNIEPYTLQGEPIRRPPGIAAFNRVAYSAAHVVAHPLAAGNPWTECHIDWDATIAYRRHLWSLGLGVAEAMDTAQRGMGLDWATSLALIRRSLDAARDITGARIASGCGTDHLDSSQTRSVDEVIGAYETQADAIEALNGRLILMASRALVRVARSPDDYVRVYDRILSQVKEPVILHWLGDMFDPQLKNYWGNEDLSKATDTVLTIIASHAEKVDGIKISLLDKKREIDLRRRLPADVRMYTGDDFNYAELIAGDGEGDLPNHRYSDALLGIFDAIAPAASAALASLAAGDIQQFKKILAPTVPLSRHIFAAPTRFYKTGVVFMAWLNGHQNHFCMVGGQQSARSTLHMAELFRLADQAGVLEKPDLAATRMRQWLEIHGIPRG